VHHIRCVQDTLFIAFASVLCGVRSYEPMEESAEVRAAHDIDCLEQLLSLMQGPLGLRRCIGLAWP